MEEIPIDQVSLTIHGIDDFDVETFSFFFLFITFLIVPKLLQYNFVWIQKIWKKITQILSPQKDLFCWDAIQHIKKK